MSVSSMCSPARARSAKSASSPAMPPPATMTRKLDVMGSSGWLWWARSGGPARRGAPRASGASGARPPRSPGARCRRRAPDAGDCARRRHPRAPRAGARSHRRLPGGRAPAPRGRRTGGSAWRGRRRDLRPARRRRRRRGTRLRGGATGRRRRLSSDHGREEVVLGDDALRDAAVVAGDDHARHALLAHHVDGLADARRRLEDDRGFTHGVSGRQEPGVALGEGQQPAGGGPAERLAGAVEHEDGVNVVRQQRALRLGDRRVLADDDDARTHDVADRLFEAVSERGAAGDGGAEHDRMLRVNAGRRIGVRPSRRCGGLRRRRGPERTRSRAYLGPDPEAGSLNQEQLTRLVDVGRRLVAELDPDVLLERLLEEARDLTDSTYAALGILDERREQLEQFLTIGIDEETRRAIGDLPRGRGVLGVLIDDPRPLRLAGVRAHLSSYGVPPAHPPMRTFLGVPIVIKGEAWGNLYLTEKRSGDYTEDDEEAIVVLAAWAGIAIQNARLYRAASARRDELERVVRALETTAEISRVVGGELELDRVLELVVKRGRALVGARGMLVALSDGTKFTIAAIAGEVDSAIRGAQVPQEGSLAAIAGQRRARRIEDGGDALLPSGPADARAALLVPLVHRGQAVGILAAYDRLEGGPGFSAEDERLIEAFAASAATALATAQNVAEEQLRRSLRAAEDERGRWARELHDETLQDLAAVRILLRSGRRPNDPWRLRDALDQALGQLADGHP